MVHLHVMNPALHGRKGGRANRTDHMGIRFDGVSDGRRKFGCRHKCLHPIRGGSGTKYSWHFENNVLFAGRWVLSGGSRYQRFHHVIGKDGLRIIGRHRNGGRRRFWQSLRLVWPFCGWRHGRRRQRNIGRSRRRRFWHWLRKLLSKFNAVVVRVVVMVWFSPTGAGGAYHQRDQKH